MGAKVEFWKGQLDAWRGGGLTQAAYCRQQDLSVAVDTDAKLTHRAD